MYAVKARINDLGSNTFTYDGTFVYALAKRIQIILTEEFAKLLKPHGIDVNSMHPGWADTEGLQFQMPDFHKMSQGILRSQAEGADTIIWLATARDVEQKTGLFWFDRKSVRTNMPLCFTDCNAEERKILMKNIEKFCDFEIKSFDI